MPKAKASSATPATPDVPAAAAAPATVTKSEAVRQSLAAGLTNPEEALAWIRDKFGIVMTPQHFSAVKAHDKRRGTGSNADALVAMESIKPLVLTHGIEKVKRMVELCG